MRALSLVAVVALAGCFSPKYGDGDLACEAGAHQCPDGYYCASDNRCWSNGKGPDGQISPTDGGDEGPDLSDCIGGDSMCPADCNANNDSDCQPMCGNGAVEAGEGCDDGNTVNGDACDPTCQYSNAVTTLSGHAGGNGWADSTDPTVVRFNFPTGLTTDSTNLYVADGTVIRQVNPTTGATTTIAGKPGVQGTTDGMGGTARFQQPQDVVYLASSNSLFIIDSGAGSIRKLDLATKTVSTVNTLLSNPLSIDTDGTNLIVLDNNGLNVCPIASCAAFTKPFTQTTLAGVAGSNCSSAIFGGLVSGSPFYYFGCGSTVLTTASGSPAILAGVKGTLGCADGVAGAATFRDARGLHLLPGGGGFWMTDGNCHTVRKVNGNTVTTLAGVAGTGGGSDGANLSATFNFPFEALGLNGNVYVVDDNNSNIRTVGATQTTTLAALAPSLSVTFGTAMASRYATSMTMFADGGTLWAATKGESATTHIFSVNLSTGASQLVKQISGNNLNATAITKIGALLYVGLGNGTIHAVATDGSSDTVYAGTAFMFGPSPNGTPRASAQLFATALATDGTNLFYFDNAHLVREIDAATGTVNTIAGTAGSTDVVDSTGGGVHFAFAGPLAYANNTLYTVDGPVAGGMTVVRQITLPAGAVATLAGVVNMQGATDGVGGMARFAALLGIATDGQRLFLTDPGTGYNNGDANGPTIRELILSSGAVSTMIGTRGQWTTQNGVGSAGLMNAPGPITYDAMGKSLIYFDGEESVFQRIK